MIFLLLQGVYFQLFVCKVIRLYNLPLQLTEQNKRTECLRKSITYRPCSRRGKSSLSQGRSSDSFPPLRLPSLKPVAKSARSCPIRAETHSNGYCRRFSRHSLIISGNRITSGKPCDAKLQKISGITSKNGRNGTKWLNINTVRVSDDAKPKMLKKQRKAELSRRTVCKSLPAER